MRLPRFDYAEPGTVNEACGLLRELGEQAKVLAGGTDLLVMMKQRVVTPQRVVNIRRIPGLDYIQEDSDCLRIGALTTLRTLETSPAVQEAFPMLSQAAGRVASRHIQNTATIGGNLCLDTKCWYFNQSHNWKKSRAACFKRGGELCHVVKGGKRCYAVLSGDTVSALIALSARVRLMSAEGERELPVEQFFTGIGETPNVLKIGEMVTEIRIPHLPDNARGAFAKHSIRGAIDFAIADAAAVVVSEDGICKDAKIVISSVGPAIIRATKAEEILKGSQITNEILEEASEAVVKEAHLISAAFESVYYRRKVIRVLAKRTIIQAAGVA